MKKRILSLVLTVAMLFGVMPFAVSAAEEPSPYATVGVINSSAQITPTMTISEANSEFKNSFTYGEGNQMTIASGSYTYLVQKTAGGYTKPDTDSYFDPTLEYWVFLDLYSIRPLYFSDEFRDEDMTGVSITINGNKIDLSEAGVTHEIKANWSNENVQLALPLSVFGVVDAEPQVKSISVDKNQLALQKGNSHTFTATVISYMTSTDVIWSFKEGYAPANAATTIVNGLLTVAAEETASEVIILATAAADNTKYQEIHVFITDEAPTFTTFEFELSNINLNRGVTSPNLNLRVSGTEVDKRVTFTLSGHQSSGTCIAYTDPYGRFVQITVSSVERAEVITLTATSVAHPEISASMTITLPTETINADIYVNLDYDAIEFDTTKTEGELQTVVKNAVSFDSLNSIGFEIVEVRLNFSQSTGVGVQGIGTGDALVTPEKDYMLCLKFAPKAGYTWSEDIINSDYSEVTVYVNGQACKIKYTSYNSYWKYLDVTVIPEWFDADFTGASLSLGSDLSMNYYVKHNDVEDLPLNKMAVQFTFNERTVLVKNYTIVDGEYVFTLKGIAPQEASDNISASIVELNDNGTVKRVIRTKATYSVQKNIYDLKTAHSDDAEMLALLKDLVWYCDYAQKYLSYTPNGSIQQNISSVAGNEMSAYAPVAADNVFALDNALATGSRLTAAGVYFSFNNKIYVKIVAEEAVTLVVKKAGAVVDTVTLDAGVHTYYTEGILATEFDVIYTFELTVGESATPAQTLTYSVNSYAIRTATKTEYGAPSSMANLARALYNYGKACEAFVAVP